MSDFKHGDRVIRISGWDAGMGVGDKGTVIGVGADGYLLIKEYRSFILHAPSCFKLLLTCPPKARH